MSDDLFSLDDFSPESFSASPRLLQTVLRQCRQIIDGEDNSLRAYAGLAQTATLVPGITSVSVYLPPQGSSSSKASLVASTGKNSIAEPRESAAVKNARMENRGRALTAVYREGNFVYADLITQTAPIGTLCLEVTKDFDLSGNTRSCIEELALHIGYVFERSLLKSRIETSADRLEMLNELNQIIAATLTMDRLGKTLCREAAFRFTADKVMLLTLNDVGDELEICGCYGCSPEQLPNSLSLQDTLLAKVLRLGGIMSVPDLSSQQNHNLDFLQELDVSCIHCTTIEAKGSLLGALVVCYSRETEFSDAQTVMLEEYAHGAAVAVSNSYSQGRLTAHTERLEELVEQRTRDLELQTNRAKEANQAKSRFVANMSHELRTPLTAIVGYSSVLCDGLYGELNEKQQDALVSIAKSAEHLKELIDEVLNLSRIEAGKEEPEPSKIELFPLMKQVSKLVTQSAVGKGVTMLPLPEKSNFDEVRLFMDPRHVRQILINLMSNAVKYTPSEGSVQLTAEIIADKAKISVIDTGVGLSDEQQLKLFERFERGDNSYSKQQSGTGIGLALTKHLTEINGGVIGVESQEGKGSTFWIMVPLADSSVIDEHADETEEEQQVYNLDGLQILIVDDNELACEMLETIVKKSGGSAYTARSVAEAKKIAADKQLDAALVDLAMPGESGLDLISYFRTQSLEPLSTMPLIVVSACVFENDRKKALEAGASYFIAKPFRPTEITRTLRELTTASILEQAQRFK